MPAHYDSETKKRNKKIKIFPWFVLIILLIFIILTMTNTIGSNEDNKKKTQANKKVEVKDKNEATEDKTKASENDDKIIGQVEVLISELNFRSSPEISGDNIIGSFNKGDMVDVMIQEEDWYKLKTKDGKVGYVNSDKRYVKFIKAEK